MANELENECKGVIPGTFIACGEGGNFCSDECLDAAKRGYFAGLKRGRLYGAAVAFGLMGMAEAIRAWHFRAFPTRFEKVVCIDDECADCGAAPGEYCKPGCPNDE